MPSSDLRDAIMTNKTKDHLLCGSNAPFLHNDPRSLSDETPPLKAKMVQNLATML